MDNVMRIKKNNKGNTLAIVIIGIFVLSILGTLILGLTATNYKTKLTEKKSETVFYYSEKAIDEVYAGIGAEVMQCAKASYEEVMENFVYDTTDPTNPASTVTTTITADEASDKFKDYYLSGNSSGSIVGVQTLYPMTTDTAVIQNVLTRLQGYITSVSGVTTELVPTYGSGTGDKTTIEYVKNVTTNLTETINIKNVCVKTTTDKTGYYSSILVDFKIKVPNVSFEIADSIVPANNNVDVLASYTLIAQGSTLSDTNKNSSYCPTILVSANSNVSVKGNTYAGMSNNWNYYGNDNDSETTKMSSSTLWRERSAIAVEKGATLNIASNNVVCDGPITVAGGKIDFRGADSFGADGFTFTTNFAGAKFIEDANVLNLYATDLITEGTDAKINIVGNCIISDDMEINGNQSEVAIKGNYFGYGFQTVNDADITQMSNSDIKEADSGVTETGFVSANTTVKEHEKRSAIIVNGKQANVDLTGLKKLILAGRAYIDLDSGTQYGNASYMTGESVSFKGNQQIYLADSSTGLAGANGAISSNPMAYDDLKAIANISDNQELTYSDLGLNSDIVVAKKVASKVYFYNKKVNSVSQSQYFISTYATNSDKRTEMESLITDTLQVNNLKFSSSLEYYTVGAFMSVENGALKVYNYNNYAASAGFTSVRFYNLVKEMIIRKSYMTPSLTTLAYKMENSSIYNGMSKSSDTRTVYDYYVGNLSGLHQEEQDLLRKDVNVTYNGVTDTVAHFVQQITGKTWAEGPSYSVGFYVDLNDGTSSTSPTLREGIWISKAPISIDHDFSGILITDSSITISGDATISTNEELIKFMLTCDDPNGVFTKLRQALNLNVGNSVVSSLDIDADGITYTDVVEKSNWRKNNN